MNIKGNKHLTLEEREVIQQLLNEERTREDITEAVAKKRKTISLKVKTRRNKAKIKGNVFT